MVLCITFYYPIWVAPVQSFLFNKFFHDEHIKTLIITDLSNIIRYYRTTKN